MAPAGRPPYTQDQIKQIDATSTKAEQTRARAELNSYIARMKRELQEKEQRERVQREKEQQGREQQEQLAQSSTGYHNSGTTSGYSPTGSYNPRGRGASNSYRGGSPRERGAASYHPYQRPPPPHGASRFKNRSVVFNKPESSADASKNESTSGPSSALTSAAHSRENSRAPSEPKQLCATFTSTGLCTRYGCPLLHDPDQQALCKRWLFKNDCKRGDHCALSHEPTPHNVPTCLHFQEARCTNEECRFAHIRVSPAAQVCDAFGRLGYCEKGGACADLHAYECPDFANKGECIRGDKCQHRHVRRASRMRKTTIRSSSPEDQSRATSAEAETIEPQAQSSGIEHLFAQQEDYVPLDAEG